MTSEHDWLSRDGVATASSSGHSEIYYSIEVSHQVTRPRERAIVDSIVRHRWARAFSEAPEAAFADRNPAENPPVSTIIPSSRSHWSLSIVVAFNSLLLERINHVYDTYALTALLFSLSLASLYFVFCYVHMKTPAHRRSMSSSFSLPLLVISTRRQTALRRTEGCLYHSFMATLTADTVDNMLPFLPPALSLPFIFEHQHLSSFLRCENKQDLEIKGQSAERSTFD